MTFQQRVKAFLQLGRVLAEASEGGASKPVTEAYVYNQWFTEESQRKTFAAWAQVLTQSKLEKWLGVYEIKEVTSPKTIAIVMAGNIPLVGFHDLLCVLLSGNRALVKMSSDDKVLSQWIIDELLRIELGFNDFIIVADEQFPKGFDAVIATGSNNSNRYFEYYFRNYPGILRRNRNSVAILSGHETDEDMKKLAEDIFLYFGLGCRNVSKIYLPRGFNFEMLYENTHAFADYIHHNKYANNYTYHKAIWLMNQDVFLDNGFLLLKESESLASPLASVYYEYYDDMELLQQELANRQEEIQCVVSKTALPGSLPFGKAQYPELWDYADGKDTMQFLLELH